MDRPRLFIVGQLPIRMRYQEWWVSELSKCFGRKFNVYVLGESRPISVPHSAFSVYSFSVKNEVQQILDLQKQKTNSECDVLLHCDISFPGIFHSYLCNIQNRFHKLVAICHGTSRNKYDFFSEVGENKWLFEIASSQVYDEVLVATEYHAKKLGWENTTVLYGLPDPPKRILPKRKSRYANTLFLGSVARRCPQKVNEYLEKELEEATGWKIQRPGERFERWDKYFWFLDNVRYLLMTSREETYGYQVVDAVLRGCVPIAPNDYSYPELLPQQYLFNNDVSIDEKVRQILSIIHKDLPVPTLLKADNILARIGESLR